MILPILTTSIIIHFSLKSWENLPIDFGSERVNTEAYNLHQHSTRYTQDGGWTYVMVDEVQVVSGGDGHHLAAAFRETRVRFVQRLVNEHERVHHGLPVCRPHRQLVVNLRQVIGRHVLPVKRPKPLRKSIEQLSEVGNLANC